MRNPYEPPATDSGEAHENGEVQRSPWSWLATVVFAFILLFAVVIAPLVIMLSVAWFLAHA